MTRRTGIRAEAERRANEHQPRQVFRVLESIALGHEAAVGMSQYDPAFEAKSFAQPVQVGNRLIERVGFAGHPIRHAAAALIVVDHLGELGGL